MNITMKLPWRVSFPSLHYPVRRKVPFSFIRLASLWTTTATTKTTVLVALRISWCSTGVSEGISFEREYIYNICSCFTHIYRHVHVLFRSVLSVFCVWFLFIQPVSMTVVCLFLSAQHSYSYSVWPAGNSSTDASCSRLARKNIDHDMTGSSMF